eukprot:g12876.t1
MCASQELLSAIVGEVLGSAWRVLLEFLMMALYIAFWLAAPMPVGTQMEERMEWVRRSCGAYELFRRYIMLKGLACCGYGLCVGVLLGSLGVDLAPFFGLFAFLLSFVPEVGAIVALLLPAPVILFDSRLESPGMTLFVATSAQLGLKFVFANVVEVKLVEADQLMKLHPVVILMAVTFFGFIWGPTGMLLARALWPFWHSGGVMSARSRGHSVGKLVQRFESAAPGTAKIRSQPKSHPLAFIFARWWRAVQPHEKLHLPKADVADSRSVRSTVSPSWKGEAAEEPHLSSTGTPSQDSGSRPSSSSRGEEALVTAARRFLAEHRASGSSALSAIAIRLDADSDDESEEREKGARDVLAAAKLYAHLQHLSGSLPDAFCASLGELWTSPPQEMQPASWRPSQDSMALSETAKEQRWPIDDKRDN